MDQGLPSPSAGIPPVLLPHVACVSTHTFPNVPQLSLDGTVEYLVQAPKIVREVAAMTWRFLDAPADGTLLLVWQPHNPGQQNAQPRFPTDGYIWGDAERLFTQQYKGYNVEMYMHKVGYCPPHEGLATHSRRRYRLTPIEGTNSPCDPSLWLVHWSRSEPQDQIPANRIPYHPHIHQMLHQRKVLQQSGQLMRKDFMLYDKANWPTLQLPSSLPQQHSQAQGLMAHMSGSRHQFAPMDSSGPSPAKRPRQNAPIQRVPPGKVPPGTVAIRDSALEEEHEEQDLLDLLTPAEISHMRFTKHTEWAEEVFASPWDTSQIDPVPLGLGRRGVLASLTDDFFDAPTEASIRTNQEATAKALGHDRFTAFSKAAGELIAKTKAETEAMKQDHERKMAQIKKGGELRAAERGLRQAPLSSDKSEDPFKLEANYRNDNITNGKPLSGTIQEITSKVEGLIDKRVEALHDYTCVERGGLEDREPSPPPPDPVVDTIMTDGPQDPLTGTPNFDEFTNDMVEIPQPDTTNSKPASEQTQINSGSASVNNATDSNSTKTVEGDQVPEDWVMVDKQSALSPSAQPSTSEAQAPAPTSTTLPHSNTTPATAPSDMGADLVNFDNSTPGGDGDFGGGEFNDQIDFGSLDTAGEALEGFDANGSGDNGVMQEDSAFGDALFHHTEVEAPTDKTPQG